METKPSPRQEQQVLLLSELSLYLPPLFVPLFFYFKFLCVLRVCLHVSCVPPVWWVPAEVRKGHHIPGTGVLDDCELLCVL